MIIFYNRQTGKIEGTIDGRIHNEDQLKMWVGDPAETDRIVVQWKITKWFDKEGNEVDENAVDAETCQHSPDHPQADIIANVEKRITSIYSYKVDPKTKELVKNE